MNREPRPYGQNSSLTKTCNGKFKFYEEDLRNVKLLAILTAMLLTVAPVQAATIHGYIYSWETLEIVKNVVVTLEKNGAEIQRLVSKNGSYRFEVEPGNYTITAKQYESDLVCVERISINVTENVDYRFDLILFPNIESIEPPEFPEEIISEEPPYYLVAIFVSGSVVVLLYHLKRRERKIEVKQIELPEDLREIVEIIKKEGGRITQKELRLKLGYSDAKLSLMIADLERRGVIEKVKKGRGNIIFLKDELLK